MLTWCGTCGAFAETSVRRLVCSCKGPPSLAEGGGRRAQLTRLRAGLHPVAGTRLPEAVWPDGTPVAGSGTYARLTSKLEDVEPDGFKRYVAEATDRVAAKGSEESTGKSASMKRAMIIAKAKLRERARCRRLHAIDVELEAAELYHEFVETDAPRAVVCEHVQAGDDDESKEFWESISGGSSTDRFRHCAVAPGIENRIKALSRSTQKSRLDRLGG